MFFGWLDTTSSLPVSTLTLEYLIEGGGIWGIGINGALENSSKLDKRKANTYLQKTTTCIGLQEEQIFSVNI